MSVRSLFESVIYAGLERPGQKDDPLWISNRPLRYRILPWVAMGLPCIAMAVGFDLAAARARSAALHSEAAQIPNLTVAQPSTLSPKLQVIEAGVNQDGTLLEGQVRNNTGQVIRLGKLSFDLNDETGTLVGTAGAAVANVAPGAVATFRAPITAPNARIGIVTDISVN